MEQAIVRRLKPGTLDDYRAKAQAKGTSLEAELREVIERNRPLRHKDSRKLRELAEYHQSIFTDGVGAQLTDSTAFIRWDRDTQHGKWVDDGWADDDVRN